MATLSEQPISEQPSPPRNVARGRVLVVDDNAANRALVVETLTPDGLEVSEAESGPRAVEELSRHPFDLVLLDVRMPGMDGFAALEAIRATDAGREVPVVFLTAQRDLDTFDRARSAGAVDFLTKPVRPSELLARVETLLRMQKLGVEVRAQLDEIRRQRDDLLRLHLQKERLSAFVVHDLKNPLSAMRLEADVVLRTPGMPEGARESAQAIKAQCERLHQLVLNLLDLSKADEGRMSPQRRSFDLAALIEKAAGDLASQAADRGTSIAVEVDPRVGPALADPDLLRRAVENLLENAVRHAPRGTVVTVRLSSGPDGEVELRVIDRGAGIPATLAPRIFDPFVQGGDGRVDSRGGRGLGLAFCRMAVEMHGGTIAVEPVEVGATILMRWPRGALTAPEDRAAR